ncbi:hypothetical protein [Rhodoglobus aureus]|uniref:DUF1648 domain-containing protein n=1 Tax=Rhodoglobus aureus TaxID=191497 RepID=A0ABN1VI86_9MICO
MAQRQQSDVQRDAVAAAVSWLPLIAVVATWLFWRSLLPAEVASRFGSNGEVTSTLPTLLLVGVAAAVCFIAASVGTASANREMPASERRRTFLIAGVSSGLTAAIWIVLAAIAVAAPAGAEPTMGGWGLFAPLAGIFGLVPYFIAAKTRVDLSGPSRPEMQLTEHQSGVWIETVDVSLFAWMAVAALAAIVTLVVVVPIDQGGLESRVTLGVFLVIFLGSVALARLRVRIDSRGLRIVSALMPLLRKSIPLGTIREARTEVLEPANWGGWGYRVAPGRSALLLFAGPGLTVDLMNGKIFSLSLRDPETPAALINGIKTTSLGPNAR